MHWKVKLNNVLLRYYFVCLKVVVILIQLQILKFCHVFITMEYAHSFSFKIIIYRQKHILDKSNQF